MNATKNNIGNNSTTRRKKAKTTAQTVERIRRVDESDERQLGNTERPTEISSNLSTSDAFLTTCFMPKLKENENTAKQSKRRSANTERDFYKSLSQLAKHYDITPMPTKHFNYPYNTVTFVIRQCDPIGSVEESTLSNFIVFNSCLGKNCFN